MPKSAGGSAAASAARPSRSWMTIWGRAESPGAHDGRHVGGFLPGGWRDSAGDGGLRRAPARRVAAPVSQNDSVSVNARRGARVTADFEMAAASDLELSPPLGMPCAVDAAAARAHARAARAVCDRGGLR